MLVEGEPHITRVLALWLRRHGHEITEAKLVYNPFSMNGTVSFNASSPSTIIRQRTASFTKVFSLCRCAATSTSPRLRLSSVLIPRSSPNPHPSLHLFSQNLQENCLPAPPSPLYYPWTTEQPPTTEGHSSWLSSDSPKASNDPVSKAASSGRTTPAARTSATGRSPPTPTPTVKSRSASRPATSRSPGTWS
ncbi:hypothetical protein ES703_64105 [subsurface metagenome]